MFKITVERMPLRVEFEVGSISEAIAALEEQDTNIREIVSLGDRLANAGEGAKQAPAGEMTATAAGEANKPKRGRPSNKDKTDQPDPSTAQAPAPIAPPGAPVSAAPGPNGLPSFLDRSAQAAASAPPPPAPPPPPPAPPAPVVPPSGIMAGKVIAALDARATDDVNRKMLVEWLAGSGICAAGVTYDEAVAVIRLMADDKLAGVATALAVA